MIKLDESANPKIQRLYSFEQFFEVLGLLCLTLLICGAAILDRRQLVLWIGSWFIGFLICLLVAFRISQFAIREYMTVRFSVPRQMLTLEAVKAPADLIDYFRQPKRKYFEGERSYFRSIRNSLGASRCEELKPIVFKYTQVPRISKRVPWKDILRGPAQDR